MGHELLCIFGAFIGIYFSGLSYYFLTLKEKYIRVMKKYTKSEGDKTLLLIIDDSGNRYKIDKCLWTLNFNHKDIWENIQEKAQYKIKYYGLDLANFNCIPTIVFISE